MGHEDEDMYRTLTFENIKMGNFTPDERNRIEEYAREKRRVISYSKIGQEDHLDTFSLGIDKTTGEVVDYADLWQQRKSEQALQSRPSTDNRGRIPNFLAPFDDLALGNRRTGVDDVEAKPKKRWWEFWRS